MAGLDLSENCGRVEACEGWRERFEVESRLSKLPTSWRRVSSLQVQETHGNFDQSVMEEAERVRGITPEVFKVLMGIPVTLGTQ